MTQRKPLRLVPLIDKDDFQNTLLSLDVDKLTLRQFLTMAPALSFDPVTEADLDIPMRHFQIRPAQQLYNPLGIGIGSPAPPDETETPPEIIPSETGDAPVVEAQPADLDTYPASISDGDAVIWAYQEYLEAAASFLRAQLSVMIVCDKVVVQYLWENIAKRVGLNPQVVAMPKQDDSAGGLFGGGSMRQKQLMMFKELIASLKRTDVLVIPHLDLLAGGTDNNLSSETREIIELIYEASDKLMLAFVDRSLSVPEVLMTRFDVRMEVTGVPNDLETLHHGIQPIGKVLITREESQKFVGYDPELLYKNVAGMNPIQLRHAIRYAMVENKQAEQVKVDKLLDAVRMFKVNNSTNFEVPKVKFEQIGGYADVKAQLYQALALIEGQLKLSDEDLRTELIPRGFIFYGPPGTGKTLFAKAIAHELNATIQVVSGPEIMNMYVGESERKLRELFSEARRNAPSVLVFDEFDSLATKREGRSDGGTRANNAVVAQLLTEMDGFRPNVPILVIGTTNQLGLIDEALLRPSRFRPIRIGLPLKDARLAIAKIHADKYHMSQFISGEILELIADRTDGFSGDDIQALFRQACIDYSLHPEQQPTARTWGQLIGTHLREKETRGKPRSESAVAARPAAPVPNAAAEEDEEGFQAIPTN